MRKPDELELMRVLTHPHGHFRDGAGDLVDVTKREAYVLAKWSARGWWESGVSLRSGWLTERGRDHLREVVRDADELANSAGFVFDARPVKTPISDPLAAWTRDALIAALRARHRVVVAARRVEHDDSESDEDLEARARELTNSIAALDEHDDALDDVLDDLRWLDAPPTADETRALAAAGTEDDLPW